MNHLFSTYKKSKSVIALLIFLAICLIIWILIQRISNRHQQLSVKPQSQFSNITLEAIESKLGLQVRLSYDALKQAAEQASNSPHIGEGEKQICKKILGVKACATLLWQYRIERSGSITIKRKNNALQLLLPLALDGNVTVDGRGGKLLGLRNKKINGQLELIADLNINVGKNWCPALTANLSYRWISDPKIKVAGKFNINLRKSADKTLSSKLRQFEKQFTITSVDLYPSNDRLIFDLGFNAGGFGNFFQSSGNLYLSAKPVADPESNELRFEDLQFTRIIDSDLWSVFSTVLHTRILDTLKKSTVINLAPQMAKLEKSISHSLSDPTKTGGLMVQASTPEVRLVAVNPQGNSLAAIIHVSTRLEAEVPAAALLKK